MTLRNFFLDFARFHVWANEKLAGLASGLSDDALKATLPLGPGSLHATLVHVYGAQRIWQDRWKGAKVSPFPSGDGWTLEDIVRSQRAVDDELQELIESHDDEGLNALIEYKNLKGEAFQHRLSDLMLHVFNHAVHHRSQSLHFLKRNDRRQPGGLDYIFFKMAHPTILLAPEIAATSRRFGLEVGTAVETYFATSKEIIRRYQNYSDWAMIRILEQARSLTDDQLDHDWKMGQGSFRSTLLHLYDAECWWQKIWNNEHVPFPQSPRDTNIAQLIDGFQTVFESRSQFMEQISDDDVANPNPNRPVAGPDATESIGGSTESNQSRERKRPVNSDPLAHARASDFIRPPLAYATHLGETTSEELQSRNRLLSEAVVADFGGGPLSVRIAESMIQLCVHGTLHRAQANNMLRNLGVAVLPLDYIVFLRESAVH